MSVETMSAGAKGAEGESAEGKTFAPKSTDTESAGAKPILQITDLHAWYGESHILHGLELELGEGQLITLLGRNGAGRTTTLRAIMGMVSRRTGSICVGSEEFINKPAHRIARDGGIGYCPEERGIFGSLNVEENLTLPPIVGAGGLGLDEIFSMFPNLANVRKRMGNRLSGGEQQMLAIARILRTGARILLLDEITEGLAPVIVKTLGTLIRDLKARGYTIVLVEQNFRFAAKLADRHYIIENGKVIDRIEAGDVEANMGRLNQYLSV